MTKSRALILIHIAMIAAIVAASISLDLVGAKDDALVAAVLLIGAGGAFAISGTVMHYARRDESRRR